MKDYATILEVRDLAIRLPAGADRTHAVYDMSCTLRCNEILCVVGESGSGKSVFARSIMGLLPEPKLQVTGGEILFAGSNIVAASKAQMRKHRGKDIAMIFQEPMTALNPLLRVGVQMEEVLQVHTTLNAKERRTLVADKLSRVGIADPARIQRSYPHEISGGQRQRAMIAMALLLEPSILIADEPTTALDVTTQAKILDLIKETQHASKMGVIFITHDFGVVAEIAHRVAVMQMGRLVEIGDVRQVLENPSHPYTKALISAVPRMTFRQRNQKAATVGSPEVLHARDLNKVYRSKGRLFRSASAAVPALKGVTIKIRRGETLGVVGESGSGKSTLARCIARLVEEDSGSIALCGQELTRLSRSDLRKARQKFQMVFQDPFASLDPRWKVGRLIAEGLVAQGRSPSESLLRAVELLKLVGIEPEAANRYPHEFSGGQRQRIAIARALAPGPELLIADEPVSALDVSVQAQVLKLLAKIREQLGLSMLFITHDLRVAAQVCDRVSVMRGGEIVEEGWVEDVFLNPQHAYTRELLDAVPGLAKERLGTSDNGIPTPIVETNREITDI